MLNFFLKRPDTTEDEKPECWICSSCGEVFYTYGAYLRHKCGTE